jgi:exosome complex RNA-binding protein Rrp4
MSLSETACTGHVRATRVMPRRKGGGSASCSVFCACNGIEWLEGEKEEEEEKLEGAESDIS